MGERGSAHGTRLEERWALLAMARDEGTANQWQHTLDAVGIESEIRIEDGVLTGRSSVLTQVNLPMESQLFSFAVWIPVDRREDAARALIDGGWDGQFGQRGSAVPPGFALRGALAALAVAVALIVIQVART